ncbi:MAG: SDR family NAD(P)-dependent oxidoreductase [Kangiellaceae bacterium]|nr:SDR family NAD(P)-dependent oxidoreductase [Kangiellaceae bacterium]
MENTIKGAVVAITGAGSGIGRSLAMECAKLGANIAICDIDLNSVHLVAKEIENQSPLVTVDVQQVDVAQQKEISAWADSVADRFGQINVIINNAGVALSASVESVSYKDFEWLMQINFWGVVYGTKSFLPHLKKAPWGHIINISSLFGLIGIPNTSTYNAAKFAVRGFTESLRIELLMTHKHINVSCVHPGGIKTNIANSGIEGGELVGHAAGLTSQQRKQNFNEKLAKLTPAKAAKTIINGMLKNKPRILVGADAKWLDRIQRIMPAKYQNIVVRVFR